MINNKQQKQIEDAILKHESQSSCELVAVMAKKSDEYKYIPILFSSILALFYPLIHLIFFNTISAINMYNIQILIFVSFSLLFQINTLKMKLIPKSIKYKRASLFAYYKFFTLGLNKTSNSQAIMFFISVDEKYVEIIADEGVSKKINDKYWKEVVDNFSKKVKNDEFTQAYTDAIQSCSIKLIEEFPSTNNDKDELKNSLIIC